ncbi:extracellular solute-binding protein [Paenibacillus eucommiae]|uniref:ABC-type glycerol-3-phosphate transport system substrate-binding protein n=1 Tax=Paenibacillus eucommiae TaxID=1355755 RepID=A0ABS4J6K8_9BACL|nr:extracellular solute-binding protein [Paenibacillus eucommiae]MBP1994424.1 ABC-type glycerol-3-phosphate transport system substrate-binding protein [Paenibacillus eucommiae]
MRGLSVLILVLAVMLTVAGCGASENNNGGTPTKQVAGETPAGTEQVKAKEPAELTLWVASREQDDFTAEMEAKFLEANPHITLNKVVHEGDVGNDYFQGVAAGNAPDLVSASYAVLPKYIKAGITLPLNDYIADWPDYANFPKTEQDKFTDKSGNVHTIINSLGNLQLGYNKKLFAEAGLTEPPKDWDQLLAYAKKLTKPDKQQAGYGMLTGEFTDWWFEYYVWQAGGDLTKENPDGTATLTFTDPAALKAAEFYRTLRKEKVTQSDVTMKFGDMVNAFATGKIAMMPFAGDWLSWAVSLGAKPEDIGFALMPAGPSGERGLGNSYGGGFIINPNSSKAKQDASWEFIKFYSSKEYVIALMKNAASKGAVNPVPLYRTDVKYSDAGVTMDPEMEAFLAESIKTSKPEYYGRGFFTKYLDQAIQKFILDANADPEKELQKAQDIVTKEVLEEFNKQ